MTFTFALLPILVFFGLIFSLKKGVLPAALTALTTTVVVGYFVWQMPLERMGAAGAQGFFVAGEIIFIIFGALLLFGALRKKNSLRFLNRLFEEVSADRRVHVVLIAWGLVYFLEGVAGFGTPAVIAIPLLLALGFAPIVAVVLSLVGDSVPVIFGAIGLPVSHGLLSPLAGLGVDGALAQELTVLIASLNFLGSAFIPLALVFVYTKFEKKPLSYFTSFIPFALTIGLVTAVVAWVTAYYTGPELPSVIGGVFAMLVTILMARLRIFLPKTDSVQDMQTSELLENRKENTIRVLLPYAILVILLVFSRLPYLPFREWLINFSSIRAPEIFGITLNYTFSPLYTAGTFMFVAAVSAILILGLNWRETKEVIAEALRKIWLPFAALAVILVFVQVFIASGHNESGLPSMLLVLANAASSVFGSAWPLLAPAMGALGAFASGSATVSNIIFSGFQFETALSADLNPTLILSLQGLGAAAGNMIALHNVIAALAVAGLAGFEREVIRRNLPILLIYLLIIGLVGLVLAGV